MKTKLITAAAAALLVGGLATTSTAFAEGEGVVEARVDDATLLAKIKTNLLRSSEVEGLDVNVDVRDGVVTLSGTADTQTEKANAERIAKTSDGVKRVDNRIIIKQANSADLQPATPTPVLPVNPGTVPGSGATTGTVPPPPEN